MPDSNRPPLTFIGPDGDPRSISPGSRRAAPHPLGNIQPAPKRTEADLLAALGLPATPPQPDAPPAGLSQVCDFCERAKAEHPPRWYYPTKSTAPVNFGGFEVEMDLGPIAGGWVSCDECHAFIARDDFAGLAEFVGYPRLAGSAVDQFRKILLGPGQPLRRNT